MFNQDIIPKIGTLQGFFIEFIGGVFLMVTAYTSARKGHSPATSGLAGTCIDPESVLRIWLRVG